MPRVNNIQDWFDLIAEGDELQIRGNVELYKIDVDMQYPIGGETALMIVAARGRRDLVSLLLKLGANAFVKDFQNKTAMDYANENGYSELADLITNVALQKYIEKSQQEAAAFKYAEHIAKKYK